MPTLSVTLNRGLVNRDDMERKTETTLDADEHLLVREGDIAYNMMRMWQGAFGRASSEGIVSPAYVVLRPSEAAESGYFEYAFRRARSIYLFWAYSYGLTNDRLRLYGDDFLRIPFSAPSPTEQRKIAEFLTAVDGRIKQLSQKKALLQDYKKGVMQQLFTQALRFKDDHGNDFPEWEEKRVGQFAPLQRGFDLVTTAVTEGDIPVVYSNGILRTHNESKAKGPGVVTGRSGTIGKVTFVEKDYWPHNTSLWVTNFFNNEPKFVYYFYLNLGLEHFQAGSTIPTLNRNDVHDYRSSFPSPAEQTKIANFLTALDRKIESVAQQIELTQTFKRGLLQQMFV